MKRSSFVWIMFLLILSAGWFRSCHDRDDDAPLPKGSETVRATFSLQMPSGSNAAPATYAISETDENHIAEIDVLAFKPDPNTPSKWVYTYMARVPGTDIRDKDTHTKEFTVVLTTNPVQQQFVILANVRSRVDALSPAEGADRDLLLERLVLEHAGRWDARLEDGDTGPFTPFPMWGETTQTITSASTNITGVTLLRSIARMDVALSDAVTNFELTQVHIYNSKNQCRIVPDRDNLSAGGTSVTAATVPPGDINNDPLAYTLPADARALEKSIFLCEAAGPLADRSAEATCLIVGGTYAGATHYYRIDLMRKDAGGQDTEDFRDILRNHRYRIVINSVSGPGLPSPDEAFEARSVNITADITAWNEGEVGDIIIDGQYIFSIDPVLFLFERDAMETETDDNRLSLFTDHPDGWKIESITDDLGDDAGWLSVMPVQEGEAGATGASWIRTEKNNMLSGRLAYIAVQAGRIRYKVVVVQDGFTATPLPPANCYMAAPGSDALLIPVARANEAVAGNIPADAAYTAETVWYDATGVIAGVAPEGTGPGGYLRVIPGVAEGNAVVAVKVNNKIVWSWHIWVTNYQPAGDWMDRNLGATANTRPTADPQAGFGLYYQWGRKDPFPYANPTASGLTVAAGTGNSPAYSIENPATSITDWAGATTWTAAAAKNIYDPCPEGWRMPAQGQWQHLEAQDFAEGSGPEWTGTGGYYPAAGARTTVYSPVYEGLQGFYWAANPIDATSAARLKFQTGNIIRDHAARLYFFSARCVRYVLDVDKESLNVGYGALNADNETSRLNIYTDHADGWIVESIYEAGTTTPATWLNVMAGTAAARSGPAGTSYRWISATQNSGAERSAVITIKTGTMRYRIRVTQAEAIPEGLYVGMFGGALVNVGGVWQFERPLYVQKTDESTGIIWGPQSTAGVTSDTDGKYNTWVLRSTVYPAANLCFQKNAEYISINGTTHPNFVWYLPAQKQLMAIWAVHSSFEAASWFSETRYWSATELNVNNVLSVIFDRGTTYTYGKASRHRVRCVREW